MNKLRLSKEGEWWEKKQESLYKERVQSKKPTIKNAYIENKNFALTRKSKTFLKE